MKTESQARKVYQEVRRKILTNQLASGIRLKEDHWATQIGVSRIAVREALTRLSGEGLVIDGEKGGYFVTELKPSDVREVRELREILELGAVRLAIKKMTKANLDTLEKICNDFSSMISNGYFAGACEADIKFHEMLIKFSSNQKLIRIYQHSHIPLFHQQLTKSQQAPDEYNQTDKEHRALVKAFREKNIVLAEKILIQHFARGESLVLE
ncbi:MAG: GntR family transcriptional regulator [Ginsengibacter sp.]